MKYYDVHCHIFNQNVVCKRVDVLLSPIFKILDQAEGDIPIEKIDEIMDRVEAFLNAFMQESSEKVFDIIDKQYKKEFVLTPLMFDLEFADDNNANRFRNTFYELKKELFLDLFEILTSQLKRIVKKFPQLAGRIEDLTHDDRSVWDVLMGEKASIFDDDNYLTQIKELETLASKHDRLQPFFGIDPRRDSKTVMVDKLKEKLLSSDAKFAGVKLYAPAGFSPTDPKLMEEGGVYQLCAKHQIPITVHNSNSGFATLADDLRVNGLIHIDGTLVQMDDRVHRFSQSFFSRKLPEAIAERANTINHPRIWKKVFEKHPNLKLNLAHFGGSEQLMSYVNYEIEEPVLSSRRYFRLINRTKDVEKRQLIETSYIKKVRTISGKKAKKITHELNPHITNDNRRKLWHTLYHLGWQDNWAKPILDIVTRYPNAYTDLSCFSEGEMVGGSFSIEKHLKQFKTKMYDHMDVDVRKKILYGSDFFFNLMFGPTMENYISDFKKVFGTEFADIASRNPERFLTINSKENSVTSLE